MLKIKVPATTTNFGSGFDSLGMAVNLYNEFYIESSPALEIVVEEAYRGLIPADHRNLVYRAAEKVFAELGEPVPGFRITQKTNIPMSRGLGSSASCIVAGILAANEWTGHRLGRQKLLDIAVSLEGHPDNVLPALVGGFTTAMMENGTTKYIRNRIDPKFVFFFMVPPFELSTGKARSVLPGSYTSGDAVASIARALFMAASLKDGNTEALKYACDDVIHQCYRSGLIDNYDEVVMTAYSCGADGVYLSGAGPSIAAIVSSDFGGFMDLCAKKLPKRWMILQTSPDYCGAVVEII